MLIGSEQERVVNKSLLEVCIPQFPSRLSLPGWIFNWIILKIEASLEPWDDSPYRCSSMSSLWDHHGRKHLQKTPVVTVKYGVSAAFPVFSLGKSAMHASHWPLSTGCWFESITQNMLLKYDHHCNSIWHHVTLKTPIIANQIPSRSTLW